MTTEKTGLGKLIAKIGDFFEGLFNAAAKTYNSLAPEIQESFIKGSAILDLINKYVNATPDFIIEAIQQKFPELSREKLRNGLNDVAKGLNIAKDLTGDDLEETLTAIQKHLATLKGSFWAGASELGAKLLAFAFAPAGAKWATFSSLMEYVYQKYVK